MKLKHIIKYIDKLENVILYQADVYADPKINDYEEIYSGSVFDIPWVYLNYYLTIDEEGEAISIAYYPDKKERPPLVIYLSENKPSKKNV